MTKSATITIRIEPHLKEDVERIFHRQGLTTTQVITMLYKQIKHKKKSLSSLYLPNRTTTRAIKEARAGKGIVKCTDASDLFKQLDL